MKVILFPTDFSVAADHALKYATNLSHAFKSRLILFNSCHIPALTEQVPKFEEIDERILDISKDDLLKIRGKVQLENTGLDVECIVNWGLATDTIVSLAEEKKADLIVMGTKGASGLKEALLGSNAASVLEKAPCPVLMIPEEAHYKEIKKIVFATDFKDSDFESIAFLTKIASLTNAEITVLHVVEQADDYEHDLLKVFQEEFRKNSGIRYGSISFHLAVGRHPEDKLNDFMESNHVDLLAMATRKRNVVSHLFERSLTRRMAHHSKVPLLSFHSTKK